jgi:hypothetical protein
MCNKNHRSVAGRLGLAQAGAAALEAGDDQQARVAVRELVAAWDERARAEVEQQYEGALWWMEETGWKFPDDLRAAALDEIAPMLTEAQRGFLLACGAAKASGTVPA